MEPRTKSGRVVKPSWRIRESESYSHLGDYQQEPSPARSTSSQPGRSTDIKPPVVVKRRRTSSGALSQRSANSPFHSSTDLTPLGSADSSSSLLAIQKRPAGVLPATYSSTPKTRQTIAAAPTPASRPSPPKPQSRPTGGGSSSSRTGKGPTIRSFVDFNDGSDELGIVLLGKDFWWDADFEADGAWKTTKNVKPGHQKSYRITICVQSLVPRPGRPASRGIQRLSTGSQPPAQSVSGSSRRAPSPQEILARMPHPKSKARARPPTSSHGGDTDVGEDHTENGNGSTDDDYDAHIEQHASSDSSASSAPGEPSDDDFPTEEDDDEDDFAPKRKRRKTKAAKSPKKRPTKKQRAVAAAAISRVQSPEFYGHDGPDPADDGRPRDRFGMPFPLEDDDADYEAVVDHHPPFSGGLNLGQFENPVSAEDDAFMQEQYFQTADDADAPPPAPPTEADERPPVPDFDPAFMVLLEQVVQNGELAASALSAAEAALAGSGDVDGPSLVDKVAALVGDESRPDKHEVLDAILAAEQVAADAAAQAPLPRVVGEAASVASSVTVAAGGPVAIDVAGAAGDADSADAVAPLSALADAATALDEERSAAEASRPQTSGSRHEAPIDDTTPATDGTTAAAVNDNAAAPDAVTAAALAVGDEALLEQSVTVG